LFNEAEVYAEEPDTQEAHAESCDETVASTTEPTTTSNPTTTTHKPGRKALPPELPRVDIIHDLPEDQRRCAEGHELKEIGTEVSEQLDIIPAKVQVLPHIRKKYACPCCQAEVKTAPLPAQPIPKSNASAGLLAYIMTSKFLDALPFYRQSKQFKRIGIHISRATLSLWAIRCGELIQSLYNLMQEQLFQYPVLKMDETTLQVLKEAGKAASTQSYLWVQRGGPPKQPVVMFHYSPTRSQTLADELLQGFSGLLQTDGYAGYPTVCAKNGLRHAGCWAHARRKFDEALKAQGKGQPKAGKASKALIYRCLDRKLSDSECRPNSPWKRTGAGRVFMENLQGLPIARRVIREQEVPPSSDVDGQGAAGIKPCRCRPILGQGRTKIFTVGIRHSLHPKALSY
jgi:transposase